MSLVAGGAPTPVVLFGLRSSSRRTYYPGDDRFGLRLLARSLRESGSQVSLLPSTELSPANALAELEAYLEAHPEGGILGISTDSHHLPIARRLALWSRACAPQWLIAAGGPHFVCEDGLGTDGLGPFDVVAVGHGGPFIELVSALRQRGVVATRVQGGWALEGDVADGLRYRDARNPLKGRGVGRTIPATSSGGADVTQLPDGRLLATVLLAEHCPHGCDYCFARRAYRARSHERELAAVVEAAHGSSSPIVVNLLDNNPLSGDEPSEGLLLLEALRTTLGPKKCSCILYVDPSDLVTHRARVLGMIESGTICAIYIGRDVVDERMAKRLGRRYRGRPRDASRLATEADAIRDLVRSAAKLGSRLDVSVDYLLTPFETQASVRALLEEMTATALIGSASVTVSVEFQIVCPFPGTRMHKELAGSYLPPEAAPDYLVSYWHPCASPAHTFLKLVELVVFPNNRMATADPSCQPQRQAELIDLAALLAFSDAPLPPGSLAGALGRALFESWHAETDLEARILAVYRTKLVQGDGIPAETANEAVAAEAKLLALHGRLASESRLPAPQ